MKKAMDVTRKKELGRIIPKEGKEGGPGFLL